MWDTVGSLGLPDLKLLGIPLHRTSKREYAFVNTEVGYNIEYAYQALALDERRAPFSPTVWESPKPDAAVVLQELKQCWFPGVHTSIGGGFEGKQSLIPPQHHVQAVQNTNFNSNEKQTPQPQT